LSLCFAWVPIIGDPITVVAGILRIRFLWFAVLVTAGKLMRYIVISYLLL
jgi:membrane protein YqaA with SNARE-associated domain